MKIRWFGALPALLLLSLAAPLTSASAAPAIDPWFAALPTGSNPSALLVDSDGSVFTLDSGSHSVSKISPSGDVSTTFDGVLPDWSLPTGIADDGRGDLYVSSAVGNGLWRLDESTGAVDAAFTAAVSPLVDGRHPGALATDASGDVFVVGSDEVVTEISPTATVVGTFALDPAAETQSLRFDDDGVLYAANAGDGTISRITLTSPGRGTIEKGWATMLGGARPLDVAFTHHGSLYAVSFVGESVTRVSLSLLAGHNVLSQTSLAGSHPFSIASDPLGNVYTGNLGDSTVSMFDIGGGIHWNVASLPGAPELQAIAADRTGSLFTANGAYSSVSRIGVAPRITSPAPPSTAAFGEPYTATITASGVDPLHFSFVGSPPAGLSLDPNSGVLSGMPGPAGSYAFDVIASNIAGDSPPQHLRLDVAPPPGSTGCWFWPGPCGI